MSLVIVNVCDCAASRACSRWQFLDLQQQRPEIIMVGHAASATEQQQEQQQHALTQVHVCMFPSFTCINLHEG